ncbi:uncharacterized protein ARMOST_19380 [Armillaria ostoyae]|uniref:Deoxyribonuclease NucA/NucB domain-containing protein n=1 Tax=Armillaria ostoyae TaxID=47428 RepID=A0A284S4D7_ARMOS|nr:uncharacterized protein ARMOST_19380 [Armillaria ostoyae]
MFNSILVVLCLPLLAVSNEEKTKEKNIEVRKCTLPIFEIDYETYPQSAENICNNEPRAVAPNRPAADKNRASNSYGKVHPNRRSTRVGHDAGYQCDEWPWANSNAGGAKAVTRCMLSGDNGRSGSSWGNFINSKGPQASGHVLRDNVDKFGEHITSGACGNLDHAVLIRFHRAGSGAS